MVNPYGAVYLAPFLWEAKIVNGAVYLGVYLTPFLWEVTMVNGAVDLAPFPTTHTPLSSPHHLHALSLLQMSPQKNPFFSFQTFGRNEC
jgi:hypothetical protein